MKKSLLALAALGFVGAASAQSTVTLFGIVDATVSFGSGSVADKLQLSNSGYNSSRLGVRGTEDLGGGMFAGFWLEAGLANDDGQGARTNSNNQVSGSVAAPAGAQGLTFNRRSTVSVGNKWGEIRLGRDYTPAFWNHTVYDPFGTNGVGTTMTRAAFGSGNNAIGVRASNSVSLLYGTPFNGNSLGGPGFHASLMYYMGENLDNAANKDDGTGWGTRIGWNGGPFSVAFGITSTDFLAAGNLDQWNLGGSWDLGFMQLSGLYSEDKFQNGPKGEGWLIGFTWPLGQHALRGSYSAYDVTQFGGAQGPKADQWAIGYIYNLSKRTALYATYAYVDNKNNGSAFALNGSVTAGGESSYGMDFGVRHSF